MEQQDEQKSFIEPFDVAEKDNQKLKWRTGNKKILLILLGMV